MVRGGTYYGNVPSWTPQVSLDQMDSNGVATSLLSMSTPGSWFGSVDDGRRMSREVNELAARMIGDHPGRFGLFAAIPLPDTEGSLKEIEYAFETLRADGIGIMTSYDTVPVGDKSFAPVFEELNRRGAIIFMHRTAATCCINLLQLQDKPEGASNAPREFIIDDLRAINSLLTSGTFARFPNIRWIHGHGEATLPWLAQLSGVADSHGRPMQRPDGGANPAYAPQGVLKELQKIYVDSSGTSKYMMDQLRNLGMLSNRTMFRTDVPYGNVANSLRSLRAQQNGLSPAEIAAIEYGTAHQLFPKYRS